MMFIKDGGTFQELAIIDLHNNCRGQGIGIKEKGPDTQSFGLNKYTWRFRPLAEEPGALLNKWLMV